MNPRDRTCVVLPTVFGVFIGELHDGRILGPADPEPVDHPKPGWKRTWSCYSTKCGAPPDVAARCVCKSYV